MPEEISVDNAKRLKKNGGIMNLRDNVLKALEEARNQKVIGKSLNAKVTVYVKEETKTYLIASMRIWSNYSSFPNLKSLAMWRSPSRSC